MNWLDRLLLKFNYVRLDKIKIYSEFIKNPPKKEKMVDKTVYYLSNGKFKDEIVLNSFYFLEDGYTAYIIAKNYKLKYVKVRFI